MKAIVSRHVPSDFAAELERKFFWWEHVGTQPRSDIRIVAQAMEFAAFEDVERLETVLGSDYLADVMLNAAAGWISDRPWEFWRGRLLNTGRAIPEMPPRRRFE